MNTKTNELDALIGRKIKEARIAAGVKSKALAAAINASTVSMTKYERGTASISASRVALAADFLHVQVTALVPSEKEIKAYKKTEE